MEGEAQGQAETIPEGTTETAPETTTTTEQTTTNGPVTAEEPFFDYNEIKGKPELEAAYKVMQASLTKKYQALAEKAKAVEAKVTAYDNFYKDPIAEIQRIASANGYSLTKAQAQAISDQQSEEPQFQTWKEATDYISQKTRESILAELRPVVEEVNNSKTQNNIKHLDTNYPDWRNYEEQMTANLQKHPSLVGDLDTLYRISVPESVLMARATNEALKKLKGQAANAQVSGGNNSKQAPAPKKAKSFSEAVELAKQQLAKT